MALSRSMKRVHRYGWSSSSSSTTIKSIPKELLLEVLARVASTSFTDLFNLKLTCKDFLDSTEDDYIYQQVSLEKFSGARWLYNPKESSFLNRCRKSGNLESLYREGLLEYFSCLNFEKGLESLKEAAQKGFKGAKYAYGMILLCSEDKELRKQGMEHLRFLRMSKCIMQCRKRLERCLRYMWVNIGNIMVRNCKPLCHSKSTRNGWSTRTCNGWRVKEGCWGLMDDEDDENDITMCEYCRWDHELDFFYDVLNVY